MNSGNNTECRFCILDVWLTGIRFENAVSRILSFAGDGKKHYICVFAVESILCAHREPRLAEIANNADMILCDGMPLVWLGRKSAKLDITRCYGPDIMLKVIQEGCDLGIKHYFYGGDCEDTILKLKQNLREKFPCINIVGHYVPPFRELNVEERNVVISSINNSGADIVWVGIGTPKQDFWVGDFRGNLNVPVLLAVGAAFNFHAGKVRQAPKWMMKSGLEWLFRLYAEPRRLWRRYLIGNHYFIFLLLKQFITGKPARIGQLKK